MAWYFIALALAVGFGVPTAVLTAALAQGRVGSAALEGIARQPEAAGRLQLAMIIALALIESLVIYALLIFFILQGRLPATDQALAAVGAPAVASPATPGPGH
ncbi:MAG: ATP synthase F0 subunit C [Armatimonadetes bacterium]|nr:ATP synthase F0 subunit C [Armatimonadota bacterium]